MILTLELYLFKGLVNHLGDTSEKEKVPGRNKARSMSSKILNLGHFLFIIDCLQHSTYTDHHTGQALTVRQIYRISTMYWDDKYGTQSVSNEASIKFLAWLLLIGYNVAHGF